MTDKQKAELLELWNRYADKHNAAAARSSDLEDVMAAAPAGSAKYNRAAEKLRIAESDMFGALEAMEALDRAALILGCRIEHDDEYYGHFAD
jgi:hypothetical protein